LARCLCDIFRPGGGCMLDNANCHSDEVFVNVLAYRCVVSNELRPTGEQLCRRMDTTMRQIIVDTA